MNKKLLARVEDIYAGAIGHYYKEDSDFLGAKELALVITALANVFDPDQKHTIFFQKWNIEHFDNPKSATKHLEVMLRSNS